MKLAFTTLACPSWTLEQALDAAARNGYAGIELRLLDGELLTPDLDAAQRQRVRSRCNDAGIAIVCVDTSIGIAQPDPDARAQEIEQGYAFLELAAEWGVPTIRVFAKPPAGVSEDDAAAGAVACLTPLAERGRELGVAVAIETHDAFSSGAAVARVLDQVPGPGAGALWDILHPNRVGEPLDTTLGLLGPRLLHVHIKDGRRPPDGGRNWPLTLLGEGDVPVPTILAALHAIGYTGWLAVEWEKKWHPEIPDPEVALPQHAQRLREYLAALE
jgi:fatty-acyl-CoA synthase